MKETDIGDLARKNINEINTILKNARKHEVIFENGKIIKQEGNISEPSMKEEIEREVHWGFIYSRFYTRVRIFVEQLNESGVTASYYMTR